MTITKDQIEDWIKALRSGDYKQTSDTLKQDFEDGTYGYCCLGVLESVCGREPKAEVYDEEVEEFIPEGPEIVYKRLGEELSTYGVETDFLIKMNDEGETFTEIADYIEENIQWKS